MTELLIASFVVMAASLVGKLTTWRAVGPLLERNLDYLTSFSAGVFLVVAYHLAGETLAHAVSPGAAVAWILGGALGVWLLFKLLPSLHEHRHGHEDEGHVIDTRRVLFSDGLHNVGDGMVLAAAFAVNVPLGVAAAISILIHELVQEVSEFFILREAGYSTRQALILNFLVSSTILVGALGAYFLLGLFELVEVPLLGLSTGAFLVVVLGDLIPHSLKTSHGWRHVVRHLGWFVAGVVLMWGVSFFAAHGHDNDYDTHSHGEVDIDHE